MKTSTKLPVVVASLIATLLILRIVSIVLMPLLGGLVVLLVLVCIIRYAAKDRFY